MRAWASKRRRLHFVRAERDFYTQSIDILDNKVNRIFKKGQKSGKTLICFWLQESFTLKLSAVATKFSYCESTIVNAEVYAFALFLEMFEKPQSDLR